MVFLTSVTRNRETYSAAMTARILDIGGLGVSSIGASCDSPSRLGVSFSWELIGD